MERFPSHRSRCPCVSVCMRARAGLVAHRRRFRLASSSRSEAELTLPLQDLLEGRRTRQKVSLLLHDIGVLCQFWERFGMQRTCSQLVQQGGGEGGQRINVRWSSKDGAINNGQGMTKKHSLISHVFYFFFFFFLEKQNFRLAFRMASFFPRVPRLRWLLVLELA